ncbi:MAG: thioredoxin family protein [Thermoanaerobaculia bacterium]
MTKGLSATAVAALLVLGLAGLTNQELRSPFDRAARLASDRKTLLLVDFTTEWCGWCRKLEREVYPDPSVSEQLARVVYVRLDAERDGAALAQRYGVDGFPTLLFLTPSGRVAGEILGFVPAQEFAARARSIIDASGVPSALK